MIKNSVVDLFEGAAPSWMDRAISIHGMISHGEKRFPNEWKAVQSNATAKNNLIAYIMNPYLPDDGMMAKIRGWE